MPRESLDTYYRRTYDLTLEEYNLQLEIQAGLCAACRQPNRIGRDGEPERLNVDHSHYTGKNRELLCSRCNSILGLADDSQEILIRLFEYLRKHDGSQIPGITGAEIRPNLHRLKATEPLPEVSSQCEQVALVDESITRESL